MMVSWEKLSQLTPLEREEYHYRFKQFEIEPASYVGSLGMFLIFSVCFVLAAGFYIVAPQFAEYRREALNLLRTGQSVITAGTVIILCAAIVSLAHSIVQEIKKYKWLKAHGVKMFG